MYFRNFMIKEKGFYLYPKANYIYVCVVVVDKKNRSTSTEVNQFPNCQTRFVGYL